MAPLAPDSAAEQARALSFLDVLPPSQAIGAERLVDPRGRSFGPWLVKLTPWRHHLLLGYGSPFVSAGPLTRARLVQALYLCSADYRHNSRFAFFCFRVRWFWLSIRAAHSLTAAFSAWLDAAFAFMPAMPTEAKDGAGRPVADVHWLAGWVRTGRKLLDLGERDTLHLPYVRLWQYLELELGSDAGRPDFSNKAELKKRGERLRAKNKPTA